MRRRTWGSFVLVATLAAVPGPVGGQTTDGTSGDGSASGASGGAAVSSPIPVVAVANEVDVDGSLGEAFWERASTIELGWEISPGYNTPAPVETHCRVTRSEEAFLLGCTARDPDAHAIRAYVTDRDALDGQDRIVLTLDPFADARQAFRFSVSALGVQGDALVSSSFGSGQGGPATEEDASWDAIWASAGRITETGYEIEAAIPFASLRFPTGEGGVSWRVQVERIWPRGDVVTLRNTRIDRSDGCELCQSEVLTGLGGIESGSNVQLTPTLTAGRTDAAPSERPGALRSGSVTHEFGITGRWSITPAVTVGLTANPDFSQVEADVAQLAVNNQFTLFFPERRPFFLEGSDVFATPVRSVFTRTIADPVVGAKLTGKTGPWAFGLITARDEAAPLMIPGAQGSRATMLDRPVTTVVGRTRSDLGRSSTVGVLYTGREGAGYHNRVASVDALIRPLQSLTVRAQALLTSTDYPDSLATSLSQRTGRFGGSGIHLNAQWATRDWQIAAMATRNDRGFRADAGFVPQVGTTGGNARVRRIFWGGRDRWFSRIFLEAGYWRNQEIGGPVLNGNGYWFGFFYRGPLQSEISFFPNVDYETHFGGETWTGLDNLYMSAAMRPWADLGLSVDANIGDAVDFRNARLGFERSGSLSSDLRLGRHVTVSLAHRVRRLDDRRGREIFTARVSELRGWYNFSPRSFLRVIAQARWTDRSVERYTAEVAPEDRSLSLQALYSYKLNPQTVFFLGYGDDREGADRLRATSRAFFLKIGYAWRP